MLESDPKGQNTDILLLFESKAEKINYQYGVSYVLLKEINKGHNNLHQARMNIIWSDFFTGLLEALWLVNYRLT